MSPLYESYVPADRMNAMQAFYPLHARHEGFWGPMDTLKDNQWLEGLHESGQAPWELWTADRTPDRSLAGAAV